MKLLPEQQLLADTLQIWRWTLTIIPSYRMLVRHICDLWRSVCEAIGVLPAHTLIHSHHHRPLDVSEDTRTNLLALVEVLPRRTQLMVSHQTDSDFAANLDFLENS